jgi:hypothetical protein
MLSKNYFFHLPPPLQYHTVHLGGQLTDILYYGKRADRK